MGIGSGGKLYGGFLEQHSKLKPPPFLGLGTRLCVI